MSRQTKIIGLVALFFLFIAALIGGSILVFAISRVRMGAVMNNRPAMVERGGPAVGGNDDSGRLTPPGNNTAPGRSFEGRGFNNHGRGGFDRHMMPVGRGGGFLAALRDLAIIALAVFVIVRFTGLRHWFSNRRQRHDDDSDDAAAPVVDAKTAAPEPDVDRQKGEKGTDPDPAA